MKAVTATTGAYMGFSEEHPLLIRRMLRIGVCRLRRKVKVEWRSGGTEAGTSQEGPGARAAPTPPEGHPLSPRVPSAGVYAQEGSPVDRGHAEGELLLHHPGRRGAGVPTAIASTTPTQMR